MRPVVSGIEDKYGQDFKIVHINIGTNKGKAKASDYNVLGTPTMVMFDESGREVRRLMGYQPAEDLEKAIDRILGR
jgi:thioredoxin-related protein